MRIDSLFWVEESCVMPSRLRKIETVGAWSLGSDFAIVAPDCRPHRFSWIHRVATGAVPCPAAMSAWTGGWLASFRKHFFYLGLRSAVSDRHIAERLDVPG